MPLQLSLDTHTGPTPSYHQMSPDITKKQQHLGQNQALLLRTDPTKFKNLRFHIGHCPGKGRIKLQTSLSKKQYVKLVTSFQRPFKVDILETNKFVKWPAVRNDQKILKLWRMPLQNMSSENPIVRLRPVSRYLENKWEETTSPKRLCSSWHVTCTAMAIGWSKSGCANGGW